MDLKIACDRILAQLENVIFQLTEKEFKAPVEVLNYATVGQHIRHTLEFFLCLMMGIETGVVNYDKREHDQTIENNKTIALSKISKIRKFVISTKTEEKVILETNYGKGTTSKDIQIDSNYHRELAYNIEHAVHHMAIIKIGLRSLCPTMDIPKDFGVAVSTIRHQEANS